VVVDSDDDQVYGELAWGTQEWTGFFDPLGEGVSMFGRRRRLHVVCIGACAVVGLVGTALPLPGSPVEASPVGGGTTPVDDTIPPDSSAATSNAAAVAAVATLPTGFSDELVATLASPTAIAFTPDARMLIATQPGVLRVRTSAGLLLPTAALSLAAKTCGNRDRGLLGVAVDPAFSTNHFIYVYYTFNKFAQCPVQTPQVPVNRVSRFILPSSNVVDPVTETLLIDNIPSYNGDHNAGDLQFGKDGNLYVSVGDGGCDYTGTGGCAAANDASRDENVLLGKILRITPTGGIPPDNPYQGVGTARCNATGQTGVGTRCRETFARGLRNPFRIAFDPNAAGTRFFINDVGQNKWEEIDEGTARADYGWNIREGHCATDSLTNCGLPPAGITNPVFDYGRSDGCGSITGGAFVPNGVWPGPYDGTYIFSDYVCGRMFQLVPNSSGGFDRLVFADGLGVGSAVHLAFGPNGTGTALYYTTYAGGGSVRRIVHVPGNRAPIAGLTGTPTSGAVAPLPVAFDGSASSDPDPGDTLTYMWNFGDGSPTTQTAGPMTSHTYIAVGTYTATLTVRDNHSTNSAPAALRIDVGNTPPTPTIQTPASGQQFAVGETILLRGAATDAQDGTLAASNLSWTVIRHHATHTHPYFGPVAGNGSSFTGPAPEDLLAATNSSIEVQLTATDSKGASATVSRIVSPKLVNLSFATKPTGLTLAVNGTTFVAPRTWTAWEGWNITVDAPGNSGYAFTSWSDGAPSTHTIVTPAAASTYTATFVATTKTVNDAVIGTTSGTFAYAGTWATSTGTAKYRGDDHFSSTTASSYTLRFSGTQVSLYGAKAPRHGQASVQIDNRAPVVIDQYAPTRADNVRVYRSGVLVAGQHTVKVTLTGTHQAASTGNTITIDRAIYSTPPTTTINDAVIGTTSGTFAYAGTWATSASAAKYQGDDHFSSTTASSYTLPFFGTRVALYGAVAPHHGQASVQIDGGSPVTIDQYAATRADNVLVYRSPVLTVGPHTVTVTVKGLHQAAATGNVITVDRAFVTA
jgi:glucose/arabinose dehydrogenase/PKD repeat protein